ncbi:MAG: hypothetical protein ACOC7K_02140, partial [bacterium]
ARDPCYSVKATRLAARSATLPKDAEVISEPILTRLDDFGVVGKAADYSGGVFGDSLYRERFRSGGTAFR